MGILWQDIKFGARTLRKSPGFTAIAVLALALGIGANTAIFSVADAFLLKPLNLPDPDHVVALMELKPSQTQGTSGVAPANFSDWKESAKSFDVLSAYEFADMNLTGEGMPEKVQGFQVAANFFSICSVSPKIGRVFLPGEDSPGRDGVVLLSERLWIRRFGADPKLIGQSIHIDSRPYTVIGVMPKTFDFPMTAELWVPLALTPEQSQSRTNHSMLGLARLKDGTTAESANAELNTIAERLSNAYPLTNHGWRAVVQPIRVFSVGTDTISYTYLLLGAVGFVLLIVCANVANLQLVRGSSRLKEIAIRGALGGSRWRVMRQLLTESILVAFAGAALGLLFAKWSISSILAHMPATVAKLIPGWDQIHLDARALLFTIFAAVAAGVVAGVLPSLETSRVDVNEVLKEGGRSGSSGRGRHRLRDALVVTQVALAVVLLAGSALIVRGFQKLIHLDADWQPESVLTMQLSLPDVKYLEPAKRIAFYDQLLDKLSAVPGASGVALASAIPMDDDTGSTQTFNIEGRPWRDASEAESANSHVVSTNFFKLLHIPVLQGREFTDADGANTAGVALVSRSLAQKYWPAGDAIGHRIKAGAVDSKTPWVTIVGVVADVKPGWSHTGADLAFYRTYKQAPRGYTCAFLRTSGDPMSLSASALAAVVAVDSEEPGYSVMPMSQAIQENMIGLAYVAVMMGVLGILALVLAAVGVYGVMAFTVEQRTYEIGIRMALGAQRFDVVRLVLRSGLLLTGIGLVIGLPMALGTSHLIGSLIFGIGTADPVTFVEVGLILAAVAATACWIPAQRAMRTDPIVALRYE